MKKEYIKICRLNKALYKKINPNLTTRKVIITFKQIQHINEKRNNVYDKYKKKLANIIKHPDYIIVDTKHKDTGLVIKQFDKNVIVVLKLSTESKKLKNSIITIWEIKNKRLQRYLNTHEIIYKAK